jgi:putative addiction module component (TIGR02574 family)
MSPGLERLLPEIDQLTQAERAQLTRYLICSFDQAGEESEEEIRAAWKSEIERRIATSESADDAGIPHEEVMADMRRKYSL